MAYGNNGAQNKFVAKANTPAPASKAPPSVASQGQVPFPGATKGVTGNTDAPKERTSFFKVFLNKTGNGYSSILKEDVVIPAGTKVAIFEDELTGKDGTVYKVLNVKKMTINS
jgi:hypothetical protein